MAWRRDDPPQAVVQSRKPEELVDSYLRDRLRRELEDLGELAQNAISEEAVDRVWGRVKELRELRRAVEALADKQEDCLPATYLVSATFLDAARRYLTRSRFEELVYVTGPEDGGHLFALTRLVRFRLSEKSVAHAAPDPISQTEALTQLEKREERLLAVFHSHTGRGAGATSPSSVDLSTQAGLERMGYPTIGAVFSRDGFVRFFSMNRRFRVAASGAGCEPIDKNVFRLGDATRRSLIHRVIHHAS